MADKTDYIYELSLTIRKPDNPCPLYEIRMADTDRVKLACRGRDLTEAIYLSSMPGDPTPQPDRSATPNEV